MNAQQEAAARRAAIHAMSDRELLEYQTRLMEQTAHSLKAVTDMIDRIKLPSWLKRG